MQTAKGDPWILRLEIMCYWGWPEPLLWEGLSAQGSFLLSSLALIGSRGGLGRWLMDCFASSYG